MSDARAEQTARLPNHALIQEAEMTMDLAGQAADEGGSRPSRRFLMCPPTYFSVHYRINPWMRPDEPVDVAVAVRQWQQLVETIEALGHRVLLMAPQPRLPDMVFTANGGIAIGDRAMAPRFLHDERAAESVHFAEALDALGFREVRRPRFVNEGEGDFRYVGGRILAAHGFRSAPRAADEVAEFFGIPVTKLRLVDPRFYHLDTALAVLDDATVAYWPGAFAERSRAVLAELFPDAIIASEPEAEAFCLNMISDGSNVITAAGCGELSRRLTERGFTVWPVDMGELRKAGGGAKCCVLQLHAASRS
jgi:N-dimethylarginine dimethylaminohydrolase